MKSYKKDDMMPKIINSVFQKRSIRLTQDIEKYPEASMPNSITNKYFEVEDLDENKYLIRKNGKLWPPFSRESEDFNLKKLEEKKIETNVLENDVENGFQVCKLFSKDLSMSHWGEQLDELMTLTAKKIEEYQNKVTDYKNTYPLSEVIRSSFTRLPSDIKKILQMYFDMILNITHKIEADKKERVFSHNDLLSSSIYYANNSIIMVDWEYAGENHRCFDLAFISLKNHLSRHQEENFLKSYSEDHFEENLYSCTLIKSIISFLSLEWEFTKRESTKLENLFSEFRVNLHNAMLSHSYRYLKSDLVICLIKEKKPNERNIHTTLLKV